MVTDVAAVGNRRAHGRRAGAMSRARYQGQPPPLPLLPPGVAVFGGVRGSGTTLMGARVTSMRGLSVSWGVAVRGRGR